MFSHGVNSSQKGTWHVAEGVTPRSWVMTMSKKEEEIKSSSSS